jgi:hypothetical protein
VIREILSVSFLALAIVCFVLQIFVGCSTIAGYHRLGQAHASGHEYLPLLFAPTYIGISALAQAVFSGLCQWLSKNKAIQKMAGIGVDAGVMVFFIILILIFMP